jgi:GT2 family glycosyltransferase
MSVAAQRQTPRQLSVVIVSHNCVHALINCLTALEREGAALDLDVLVVDNASRDGSVAAVATRFPWVRLLANRRNVGFASAVNQALRAARPGDVLLLNPDTIVPPGALEAALARLEASPDVGVLSCKLVRADGSFDHACKRGFPTVGSALYYFVGLSRLLPRSRRFAQYTAGHLDPDTPGYVDAVSGAFMLVRGQAMREVGLMDERYWLYAEDLDWCRRFWEHGWRILYWPEIKVLHVKGASAGDHRAFAFNLAFHRSFWLFYAKHYADRHPSSLAAIVWTGIWTKFAASVFVNSLRAVSGILSGRTAARRAGGFGDTG